MADIDKALPNVETELKVPSEEEIAVEESKTTEEQVGPDDVQITQEEEKDLIMVVKLFYLKDFYLK